LANGQTSDAITPEAIETSRDKEIFGHALVWSAPEYRADIDGLRALAVLSIMFLHLGWPTFPGAYYMLDIFFVISGYLIAGQIVSQMAKGTFSLKSFYSRRIRRILPAAMVTFFFALLSAYFVFPVEDRYANGLLILSGVYSFSNFVMAFDAETLEQGVRLMRHTWSLGVEEQFYLVFPVTILLAFALFRSKLWIVILGIGLVSFVWAMVATSVDNPANYYLTHFRIWEFAIGVLLIFLPQVTVPRTWASVLGLFSLTVIILNLLYLTPTRFGTPGPWALSPTIATAVLIIVGRAKCVSSAILSVPPMVLVGKISYSLYLWHLLIFDTYRAAMNTGHFVGYKRGIVLYCIALAFAWASWKFVESPFRGKNSPINTRALTYFIALGFAVLTVMSLGLIWSAPDISN